MTSDAPLEALAPLIRPDTRALVLGSFPGEASLRAQQYYAHPRNQLWAILAGVTGVPADAPYADRVAGMLDAGVGLWDVYARCRRVGSLDSAIRDAVPNDLAAVRGLAPGLRLVLHNGAESFRHAERSLALGVPVRRLPSTSPANAAVPLDAKRAVWLAAFAEAGIGRVAP